MSFKVFGVAPTSVVLRVKLFNRITGQGIAGTDPDLKISTIQQGWGADGESVPVVYTALAGDIETIATLGVYQAPTAGKCRFKAVDAVNHPGVFEIHFSDSRFALTSDPTKPMTLLVSISGVTDMAEQDLEIECGNTSQAVWDSVAERHLATGTYGEYFYRMMSGLGTRVKMYLAQLNIVATGNDSAIDAAGSGSGSGQKNTGGTNGAGQSNLGAIRGQENTATNGVGLSNSGTTHGQWNQGAGDPNAIGLYNNGVTGQVSTGTTGNKNQGYGGDGLVNEGNGGIGMKNHVVSGDFPGQKNIGWVNGEGMLNTGAGTGAGQMNTGGAGANGMGMYNRATGSSDAMLNFGAGNGAGMKNVAAGTDGVAFFNEATGLDGRAQYNHSTQGDAVHNLGGLNGMSNQGGTLGNGSGMKNVGAGTGLDLSAPNNDLGLNNGTALTAQEVRDAMKLAPAGGAPAAGSVDEHLDDVKAAVDGQFPELAVGESPKNPTLKQLLMRLYMKVRNKETATRSDASNGSEQVFNDAGTPILKKVYSDAGGTTTVNQDATP